MACMMWTACGSIYLRCVKERISDYTWRASDIPALHLCEFQQGKAFGPLKEDGSSTFTEVYTADGGASNKMWIDMRCRVLGVLVYPSPSLSIFIY